jgi:hypothetical protein
MSLTIFSALRENSLAPTSRGFVVDWDFFWVSPKKGTAGLEAIKPRDEMRCAFWPLATRDFFGVDTKKVLF